MSPLEPPLAATVGIAQWLPAPGQPAANEAAAAASVRHLASAGCDVVVLPELWPCGYDPRTLAADAAGAAEPLDGPRVRRLAALAAAAGVLLCAGSLPERGADGAVYNTAVLLSAAGELLLAHRKAHLYPPVEPAVFAPGPVAASTAVTAELGTVGLAVCFDGDFPETARALRLAGADVVLLPSAYETAAAPWWDTLYPASALANGQWWIMANQHGDNGGLELLGGSQVIAPDGTVAAAAPRGKATAGDGCRYLITRLPLRESLSRAAQESAPLLACRRPALYSALGTLSGCPGAGRHVRTLPAISAKETAPGSGVPMDRSPCVRERPRLAA
jgi:predicted amidohydrolase